MESVVAEGTTTHRGSMRSATKETPALFALVVTAAFATLLAACASLLPGDGTGMGAATVRVAPGPAAAARPADERRATFAFLPAEGGPDRVARSFALAIGKAAQAEGLELAPPEEATYLVKAYLSTVPSGDDELVVYVFDVLDRNEARLLRISGTMATSGPGSDPWRGMSKEAAAHIAASAATAIAAWLADAGPAP